MPMFRVDLQIAGTAYIRAESKEQAKIVIAEKLANTTLIVDERDASDELGPAISDLPYDHAPSVSLSPAMTIHGTFPGAQLEEVE